MPATSEIPASLTAEPAAATAGRDPAITPALLVALALLSAIAPLATDLYLPAFPAMTVELVADASQVQLTLTAFLVGIAAGQLAFGPLSDRFGRFRPLVIGVSLCIVASVAAAMAPNIAVLIVARFLQGFGGAAGMVIGRAIISDLAKGQAAATAFSVMMTVGGIAPIVAPFLGSLLVGPVGWRGILWVVAALAVVMLLSVVFVVRETHTRERRALLRRERSAEGAPLAGLRSRSYLGSTLVFAFGFAVMMSYISASPFVYQVMIGMTPVAYGITFGVTALGLVATSALSARLARRFPVRRLLGIGVALVLVSTLVLLVLVLADIAPWVFVVPIFTAVASLGLILGNATALALSAVPKTAGTGSAILGASQFALGALVSPLVGIAGEETALPLAIVMTASAVIALLAFLCSKPRAAALESSEELAA